MYRQNNRQGSNAPHGGPSTTSNTSLESHMTEISKTMLQLAQANQEIAKQPATKSSNYGKCSAAAGQSFWSTSSSY